MKKIIISGALLTLFACNENEKKISVSEVPQPVTAAFAAKYPNSTDVKWEQEKKDDGKWIYEAEFKINGKEIEAEFDSTGNFLKEE